MSPLDYEPGAHLTQQEAIEAAEVELLANPLQIASWLVDECKIDLDRMDNPRTTPYVDALVGGKVGEDWSTPQLVAALMLSPDQSQTLRATSMLRARAVVAFGNWIEQRARKIFEAYNGKRRHH